MARSPLSALAEEEEPSAPFWMATFSDMMTLLLTFFVMLVAMSTVEIKKFEEAMSYFTGRRGVMDQQGVMPGIMGVAGQQDVRERARQFEDIARDIHERGAAGAVDVDLTERGVRVTFVDSVAFAPGSVVLGEPGPGDPAGRGHDGVVGGGRRGRGPHRRRPHLDPGLPLELGALGGPRGGRGPVPPGQPAALAPEHYVAVGYGEFRPRAPNDIPEGRARNRRITVLFRTADAEPVSGGTPSPFHVR